MNWNHIRYMLGYKYRLCETEKMDIDYAMSEKCCIKGHFQSYILLQKKEIC